MPVTDARLRIQRLITLTILVIPGVGITLTGRTPSQVIIINGSTGTMFFMWAADPTPGVTDYHVELGTATGLKDAYDIDTGGTDTSFEATVLTGTYFARARSYSSGVAGAASNEVIITVT